MVSPLQNASRVAAHKKIIPPQTKGLAFVLSLLLLGGGCDPGVLSGPEPEASPPHTPKAPSCDPLTNKKGPFDAEWLEQCQAQGFGTVCLTDCWPADVYEAIKSKLQESKTIPPSNEWTQLSAEQYPAIKQIKQTIKNPSYWSIDIRIIGATTKVRYILFQNNPDGFFVPASNNKIFSALSAYFNADISWESMKWWIKISDNSAAQKAWEKAGEREGVINALNLLKVDIPQAWQNVDGSGLSYKNKVSATFLVEILLAVKEQSWRKNFIEALPEGCVSGTLRSMFCSGVATGTTITAKTGTLNQYKGVKALSGYGLLYNVPTLVFSVLYNGPAGTAWSKGAPKIETIIKYALKIARTLG